MFLSPSATALTVDNILKELKEVDWETLCGKNEYINDGVLDLPPSQQRRIEREYATEDERRNAAVLFWLIYNPYASWRLLIRRLDAYRKHSIVNRIRHYTEKVTGMLGSSLYCH